MDEQEEDWPMNEPEGQVLPTDEPGVDGIQGSYCLGQFVF